MSKFVRGAMILLLSVFSLVIVALQSRPARAQENTATNGRDVYDALRRFELTGGAACPYR